MRTRWAQTVLLVSSLLAAAGPARADEAEFLDGLAQVDRAMQQGSWDRAEQDLYALLEAHAERPYVLLRQNRLEDRLRECAFRAAHAEPDPSTVISGELLSYDARSGKLKLHYDLAEMRRRREELNAKAEAARKAKEEEEGRGGGIIDDGRSEPPPEMSGPMKVFWDQFTDLFGLMFDADWQWVDGVPVHPLVFDGGYTVEVEGVMPDDEGENEFNFVYAQPRMIVRLSPTEWFNFDFGSMASQTFGTRLYTTASATHYVNGKGTEVDEYSRPLFEPREEYSVKLNVSSSSISASANGKSVMKVKKSKDRWGQFGFGRCPGVTSLTITGTASPAWLKGKLDGYMSRERRKFNEDHDVLQALPSWLAERPRGRERGRYETFEDIPGPRHPMHPKHLESLEELRRKGEYADARTFLEELSAGKSSPEFKLYQTALLDIDTRRDADAVAALDTLLEMVPTFVRGHTLRAAAKARLGQGEEALASLRALLEEHPENVLVHETLAAVQILEGDAEGARDTVYAAILSGVPAPELRRAQALVEGHIAGPQWKDFEESDAGSYVVRTEVGSNMATLVARHLDDSLPMYEEVFGVPLHRGVEQRVFLFAGDAGLVNYQLETLGTSRSDAGIFVPELDQMLLANLPDADLLLSVVQHEGWHQYLHEIGVDAPIWFDEGVGEYVGAAEEGRRGLSPGKVRQGWVRSLVDPKWKWTPLDEMLALDPHSFQAKAGQLHLEAWALIHTLLKTEDPARPAFDALCADLGSGVAPDEATKRFLEAVDHKALLERVKRHVRSLD